MAGRVTDTSHDQNKDGERDPFVGNETSELGQNEIGKEEREKRDAKLKQAHEDDRNRQDDIGPSRLLRHCVQGACAAFVRPASTGTRNSISGSSRRSPHVSLVLVPTRTAPIRL